MKIQHTPLLLAVLAGFTTQTVPAQGSLTPPGAPAPTMKTLDQVEPRTALAAGAGLGSMIITQPGSYYFTGDREIGGTAFFIRTNGVTIDLNGYTLRNNTSVNIGILVDGTASNPYHGITIRNGTISGFGYGVQLSAASGCRVENITVANAGEVAFLVEANGGTADGNLIRNCTALRAGYAGFYLQGDEGVCRGNQLINCAAIGTVGTGSAASGHGIELFGGNPAGNSTGNLVENCTSSGNLRSGFRITPSAGQCQGNRITGCTATLNGVDGFNLSNGSGRLSGNIVENSQSVSNLASGIVLLGNLGSSPALGNKLSGNVCIANGAYGIRTTGSDAGLTIGNLCVTNMTANFSLDTTDINGPIVTTSGTLGTTGADAHPHANYSR